MITNNQCKTKNCTRNKVPDSFGFCNICFSKIIEIRKVKALEAIATTLQKFDLQNFITVNSNVKTKPVKYDETIKKINKPIKKINKLIEQEADFIPTMDISRIKQTNIQIQTKTDKKDLNQISQKLKNIK